MIVRQAATSHGKDIEENCVDRRGPSDRESSRTEYPLFAPRPVQARRALEDLRVNWRTPGP